MHASTLIHNTRIDLGDGDGEGIGDEGAYSCDERGEEIIGDGCGECATVWAVRWVKKGATGVIGVLGIVRKEIYSTKKVGEDGRS